MKKELGGKRLGNEEKIAVEIREYDTSNQNLGQIIRTSMSSGTVVPIMYKVALPGDRWKIKMNMVIKTHPTEGPLFGSYKAEVQIFKAAVRLYQAEMYTDAVDQGLNMASVLLPQYQLIATSIAGTTDVDNSQVNPSCVLKYLGLSGVGLSEDAPQADRFNAVTLLMLWDIYKNYLANKQEKIGAVIHTPTEDLVDSIDNISGGPISNISLYSILEAPAGSVPNNFNVGDYINIEYIATPPIGSQVIINLQETGPWPLDQIATLYSDNGTNQYWILFDMKGASQIVNWSYVTDVNPVQQPPKVVTFPLENIDQMRRNIMANIADPGSVYLINDASLTPYRWLFESSGGVNNIMSSQEGLPIKTYMSDLFNNWLNAEWITGVGGINSITAIDTTGNTFQIPQFILKKKIYDMLNNIAVSGGSIVDWQQANWGTLPKAKATRPEYEGGLIREVIFQEVVSNSATSSQTGQAQPLGTLGGKGVMGDKMVGGYVECDIDEISYIMALAMITPRIDYSQGNEWDIYLKTMDDFHKPALDAIGFQDLLQTRMAWWSRTYGGGGWTDRSTGKQPAWMEYRTSVNKTFGNFAIENNEMFMTLNRKYEYGGVIGGILDMTTYIDPVKYNSVFSYTAIDAQNFWVQVAFDMEVERKMSNRVMPSL